MYAALLQIVGEPVEIEQDSYSSSIVTFPVLINECLAKTRKTIHQSRLRSNLTSCKILPSGTTSRETQRKVGTSSHDSRFFVISMKSIGRSCARRKHDLWSRVASATGCRSREGMKTKRQGGEVGRGEFIVAASARTIRDWNE